MGRIKTTMVKRAANQLKQLYGDEFKKDFNENKLLVSQFADVPSKKIRNIIAGYITRLKKAEKQQ